MSYVITTDPCPTKFVGDMVDMIVSTDSQKVDFALAFEGANVIEEQYVAANGTVRIGGLRKVIDGILYGQMIVSGGQDYMGGDFTFIIDEETAFTKRLYISKAVNMEDPTGQKRILSHGTRDVCYPGMSHPMTFISYGNTRFKATLYDASGNVLETVQPTAINVPWTEECRPDTLFTTASGGAKVVYQIGTETFTSYIDHSSYPDGLLFRYLNIYDAPETLLAKKALGVKPGYTGETGIVNGIEQRFAIEGDDEYEADSGALAMREQYMQWRDLLVSRKVEVLWNGQWLPVIVSKANYQQTFRKATFDHVTFSFKLADKNVSMI